MNEHMPSEGAREASRKAAFEELQKRHRKYENNPSKIADHLIRSKEAREKAEDYFIELIKKDESKVEEAIEKSGPDAERLKKLLEERRKEIDKIPDNNS